MDVLDAHKEINSLTAGSNADLGLMRALAVKEEWVKWLTKKHVSREIHLRCYSAAQGIPPAMVNGTVLDEMARRIEIRFTQLNRPDAKQPFKLNKNAVDGNMQSINIGGRMFMKMIHIEPGTFSMGSPEQESLRDIDEQLHEVRLTQGYWLGETEVTKGQWYAVMEGQTEGITKSDRPAVRISWYEAVKFCDTLNGKGLLPPGWRFALPSEAQWEFACRAGSRGAYAGELESMAWFNDLNGKYRQPARTKKPNAWGFYDMHGNVWEWCSDAYGPYPEALDVDPKGGNITDKRVNRGGGWHSSMKYCRSAYRDWNSPTFTDSRVGFRLAIIASPKDVTRP